MRESRIQNPESRSSKRRSPIRLLNSIFYILYSGWLLSGCEHECPAQTIPPFPTNAAATNAPVLTLMPPAPPSATLAYDSGAPTNHFYLVVADQYAGGVVTFSNLTPGVPYGVIAASLDPATGLESSPSPQVKFILPANTPILVVQNGVARVRATVMQPSTLQTSPDLFAWTDFARLQTNMINDWSLPESARMFFRINQTPAQ